MGVALRYHFAMAASLKSMMARIGEEKARARTARSGPPADGNLVRRVEECLELHRDLTALRFSHLVAELGSEAAARERMRSEAQQSARDHEETLLRIQARLYGSAHREQAEA